jgi:hypothetical protein
MNTESPLKRQLLIIALITGLHEEEGKNPPIIIGGCALSYYFREVYFTADIDLAYADREALDTVLANIGFEKRGRYWVNEGLKMAIEAPPSVLAGEDSPIEVVDLGEGLQCRVSAARISARRGFTSFCEKQVGRADPQGRSTPALAPRAARG